MTGLPIHLFLHQHPSLPPSLRLSRLPPKARHLRVYHVYTPPDNPPSFLLEKSYRPAASPIHPLAIPLCVFEGEGEREREFHLPILPSNEFEYISFVAKIFQRLRSSLRRGEERAGGRCSSGRKEKEEDSSDDDDRLGFHER